MGAVAICSSGCDLFGNSERRQGVNTTGEGILKFPRLSLAHTARKQMESYLSETGSTEISTLEGNRLER
jgi:hypothetical protein